MLSCDDLIGVAKTDMLVATISLVQARHVDLIHEVKQRALAKEFEVSEPSLLVVIFSLAQPYLPISGTTETPTRKQK